MVTRTARLAMVTALLWFGFGVGGRARAALALPTPGGLSPGQSFRFVFVTDGTTTATSSNIADYNSFVNAQAEGATYDGMAIKWDAIASTPTENAIANVGPTQAPVYLADGTFITATTTSSGLWSGNLQHPIAEDVHGVPTLSLTWTGTLPSGLGGGQAALGGGFELNLVGTSGLPDRHWVDFNQATPQIRLPLYAISQELTVPSVVPEPSTLLMAGTGIGAGFAYGGFRRRRDQRRQRPVGQTDAIE
jgi:PEP-CTERM motif-containing protein